MNGIINFFFPDSPVHKTVPTPTPAVTHGVEPVEEKQTHPGNSAVFSFPSDAEDEIVVATLAQPKRVMFADEATEAVYVKGEVLTIYHQPRTQTKPDPGIEHTKKGIRSELIATLKREDLREYARANKLFKRVNNIRSGVSYYQFKKAHNRLRSATVRYNQALYLDSLIHEGLDEINNSILM